MGRLTIERPTIVPTIILSDDPIPTHYGSANFRPRSAQEGQRRGDPPARETQMSLALKRAQETKREKRAKEKAARKLLMEERLAALKAKPAGEKSKPAPQRPKWDDDDQPIEDAFSGLDSADALNKIIGAPGTPQRREHMRQMAQRSHERTVGDLTPEQRAARLRLISLGQSPAPSARPFIPEQPPHVRAVMPTVTPPAPDDPRLRNGTLAPSPRVAEHIKASTAAVQPVVMEKPLQTSSAPDAYAQILETGTPRQILAGRKPADLKGAHRDAYYAALRRAGADPLKAALLPRKTRLDLDKLSALGRTIYERRRALGLTVTQIAARAGVAKFTINRAAREPDDQFTDEQIRGMAVALEVQFDDLRVTARPPALHPQTKAAPPAATKAAPTPEAKTVQTPADFLAGRRKAELSKADIAKYHHLLGLASVRARRARAAKALETRKPAKAAKPAKTAGVPNMFPLPAAEPAPLSVKAKYEIEVEAEAGASDEPFMVAPLPKIEKNIPVPKFRLSSEMYGFERLKRGESIYAEVPYGWTFEQFRSRFSSLVHLAQKATKHWYTCEAEPDRTAIRCWRVV